MSSLFPHPLTTPRPSAPAHHQPSSDLTTTPLHYPSIHLLMSIHQLLAMFSPPTPADIPTRLTMLNSAIYIPPPINTLELSPIINILILPLRPAAIHAVHTKTIEVPKRRRARTSNLIRPIHTAQRACTLVTHAEGLQAAENIHHTCLRKRLLKRIGVRSDERGKVMPRRARPLATCTRIRAAS
jgi:hypothetical protein